MAKVGGASDEQGVRWSMREWCFEALGGYKGTLWGAVALAGEAKLPADAAEDFSNGPLKTRCVAAR